MKTLDRSLSTTRPGELAQDGHVNNPSVTTDRRNGLMSLYADAGREAWAISVAPFSRLMPRCHLPPRAGLIHGLTFGDLILMRFWCRQGRAIMRTLTRDR
jgi:hypothetical protein